MAPVLFLRSVTYTVDLFQITDASYRSKVATDISAIKSGYASAGVEIRTVRLNVLKIDSTVRYDLFAFSKYVEVLAEFAPSIGVRWFNLAFDLVGASEKNIKHITFLAYEIMKRHRQCFINLIISNDTEVNPMAAREASSLVAKVSRLSWNGFDNFRLGISVNPSSETPFFPFSFSNSNDLSYSVAVETTQPFIAALVAAEDLEFNALRKTLVVELSALVRLVEDTALEISRDGVAQYKGQDISLAPFPDSGISVIKILSLLGLNDIGENGTLFFTAFLTSVLKAVLAETNARAIGFNGVMYSLLEDHLMCASNNAKKLDINKITSYSTLCGCGLDMVPIPGNFLIEDLAAVIIDVATLAIRHRKPLGVRVLPIPNKSVNEFTEFDSDFLTNTRVMEMSPSYTSIDFFSKTKQEIL